MQLGLKFDALRGTVERVERVERDLLLIGHGNVQRLLGVGAVCGALPMALLGSRPLSGVGALWAAVSMLSAAFGTLLSRRSLRIECSLPRLRRRLWAAVLPHATTIALLPLAVHLPASASSTSPLIAGATVADASAKTSVWLAIATFLVFALVLSCAADIALSRFVSVGMALAAIELSPVLGDVHPVPRFMIGVMTGVAVSALAHTMHLYLRRTAHLQVANGALVDELRSANQALAERLVTDPLTNVTNRVGLEQLSRSAGAVGLLYVDVDNFKGVNDRFGHDIGDGVLVRVADVLTACVRPGDVVARLGGDEFVVLLPGADSDRSAGVAERIGESLRATFADDDRLPAVTVSVGVAVGNVEETGWDGLLRLADKRLYGAKRTGRDRVMTG